MKKETGGNVTRFKGGGVENTQLLESDFGGWPSFHDAEIHSILITRDCDSAPQMDISIHHWGGDRRD